MSTFVVDDIIFWLQNNGGASRYWYEIISRLELSGNVVFHVNGKGNTLNPWARRISFVHKMKSKIPVKIDRYLDCKLPVDLSTGNVVFHSSHYRVPKDEKVPNVVTVHDFTYELHKSGLAKLVHVWQKRRAVKKSDVIICISEYTKNLLLKFYPEFKNKKILVVYHGVGDEFYCKSNESLSVSNEVVFLGSRDKYKRFDLAVDAISLLNEKNLKIVGAPLSPQEEKYLNKKIQGRWIYAGRLSDSELNLLYNEAFCFVYPSDSEGFGLPLLEAMKAGCPVVCANKTVFPEIAGNAAIFSNEQTGESYAQQIRSLEDSALRAEMIRRGIERVSIFNWDQCFEKTLDAYKQAINIRHKRVNV